MSEEQKQKPSEKEEKKPEEKKVELSKNMQTVVDVVEKMSVLELSDLVKALEDKFGIGSVFDDLIIIVNRGRHDRIAKVMYNIPCDIVIRDPDTDGFLPALEDFRYFVAGTQNKGKGSGKVPAHHLICGIVDGPGVFREVAEVMADEAEISLFLLYTFDLSYAIYSLWFVNIAAYGINGIRRKDDHPSVHEAFHHQPYLTRRRSLGMYS